MNLNLGGNEKKPKMRDTIFDGKIQTMNFPERNKINFRRAWIMAKRRVEISLQ